MHRCPVDLWACVALLLGAMVLHQCFSCQCVHICCYLVNRAQGLFLINLSFHCLSFHNSSNEFMEINMNAYEETTQRKQYLCKSNEDLIRRVLKRVKNDGKFTTAINGLRIIRCNNTGFHDCSFHAPSINIILQGSQKLAVASDIFCSSVFDCMVSAIDMLSISRIVEATPDKPMLVLSLDIDRELLKQLVSELPCVSISCAGHCRGISVAPVETDIFDVFVRLVHLLDKPEQIPLMGPLLIQEVIIRILMGPQGISLRTTYQHGSYGKQIATAIVWLKDNYMQPLIIDELAIHVNMATSSFHRKFKQLSSISPLQYQKRLRLYEAQRLMFSENRDANTAALAVGYESAQQFNREYKRLFGEPPYRNIDQLRKSLLLAELGKK